MVLVLLRFHLEIQIHRISGLNTIRQEAAVADFVMRKLTKMRVEEVAVLMEEMDQ